ncbi:MAG: COX15/CtaA family protein [Deinococcales bacterium]|nr:COX15/CtaA family protein [Chitinophagaceae bacterium]
MASKSFRTYVWFVLVNIFLVIVAGSVVRTTQSGMGCPDWPTCFGTAIPPTSVKQVQFQPNYQYKKGQFIIYNDSLKYATQKFVSSTNYNQQNWQQYEKHNNAAFSVLTTWIEYLNRLLGALLGIFIAVQFLWSLWFWRQQKSLAFLSFVLILLTGFQAWLGKTVVDSNLAALKISLHLFGALAMVFLCLYILFLAKGKPVIATNKKIVGLNILLLFLVLMQIVLGTNVRAEIDVIATQLNYLNRSGWVEQLNIYFYIHRSFSLVIAGIAVYLLFISKNYFKILSLFKLTVAVIIAEIMVGIVLVYLQFPAAAQPIHLLLSSILVAVVFNNYLRLVVK